MHINLDTKYSGLEPQVQHAIMTARQVQVNIQSHLPSPQARSSALAAYHHALTRVPSLHHTQLESRGITTAGRLVHPIHLGTHTGHFIKAAVTYPSSEEGNANPHHIYLWSGPPFTQSTRKCLLEALLLTNWHPRTNLYADSKPQGKIAAWQDQHDIKACICIHTDYCSILVPRYGVANLCNSLHACLPCLPTTNWDLTEGPRHNCVVHIYTNGSAMNNGSASCVSTVAWVSDTRGSNQHQIISLPSSNNVAEVVTVALALHSWQQTNIHIHTDSKYVLRLLEGGLLEMENDGWSDTPWVAFPPGRPPRSMNNLLMFLLYLIRKHQGSLSITWVKAHAGSHLNKKVDKAAKAALASNNTVNLPDFQVPPGWIDTSPLLGGRSLASLTSCMVRERTRPPLSEPKCAPFLIAWSAYMLDLSDLCLHAGLHAPHIWSINVPPCL